MIRVIRVSWNKFLVCIRVDKCEWEFGLEDRKFLIIVLENWSILNFDESIW